MKKQNYVFILSLLLCYNLKAAELPGVKTLFSIAQNDFTSFIIKDKDSQIWIGRGSFNHNFYRVSLGLMLYANNTLTTPFTSGVFTDALELDSEVLITSYDGLYHYKNGQFTLDNSMQMLNCVIKHKNSLWLGSMGNGLYSSKNNQTTKLSIIVDGVAYDSILSLNSAGNILWIGTSNGLLKYENGIFSKLATPVKAIPNETQYERRQRQIKSIQTDQYGNLWILNNNLTDSVPAIYYLYNNQFNDPMLDYRKECIAWGSVPFAANKLARSANGHILIGTSWGLIDLSATIVNYPIKEWINQVYALNDLINRSNPKGLAWEDSKGITYLSLGNEYFELDKSKYNIQAFKNSLNLNDLKSASKIDINDIEAGIGNVGMLFNSSSVVDLLDRGVAFHSKSLACTDAMFSAGLWFGGISQSDKALHIAAQTYRKEGNDYWPGPINTITRQQDSTLIHKFNKIWKIDRKTIDNFKLHWNKPGYNIPESILDWPGNKIIESPYELAPFVDVDFNGIYEPSKGDYPLIKGDQMLWWVFNDLGIHSETDGKVLGIQVNASCYAFNDKRLQESNSDYIINRSIFFNYHIINTSSSNYEKTFVGLFNDVDLGNYANDVAACDSAENTGMAYNNSNYDEGKYGFGKNPPLLMCKMLNQKMDHFRYYRNNSDPFNGNPRNDSDFYAYMQSAYFTGDSFKFFQSHYLGGPMPCLFNYTGNSPTDIRFVMSSSLETLNAGESIDVEFAYILLHDPAVDFLKDSCNMPRHILRKVQHWYDTDSFPSKPYWDSHVYKVKNTAFVFVYPNPSTGLIQLNSSHSILSCTVYDVNGRVLFQKSFEPQSTQSIDLSFFETGIYLIRVETENGISNQTIRIEN